MQRLEASCPRSCSCRQERSRTPANEAPQSGAQLWEVVMHEAHMTTALSGETEDSRRLCRRKFRPGAEDPEGTADLGENRSSSPLKP